MKITEHIYLAGSGCMGLSAPGDCNIYAVESGGEILLIDCGLHPTQERLLDNLREDGLNPDRIRGVLLTHIHPDHSGGVPFFQKMGIPVMGSGESDRVLRRGIREVYQMDRLPPSGFRDFFCGTPRGKLDRILQPGEHIRFGALELEMIPTPAHTVDSVCYLLRLGEKKHLFTGDTLFYPGHINYFVSPLSCVECYPETIRKLAELAPDGLYPGHALFMVDGAQRCTQTALEAIERGVLPPLKPYS